MRKTLLTAAVISAALTGAAYAQTDSTRIPSAPSITYGDVAARTTWDRIEGKPQTATRWPDWEEITGKPLTFTPEGHNHDSRYLRTGTGGSINGKVRINEGNLLIDRPADIALHIIGEGKGSVEDDIFIDSYSTGDTAGSLIFRSASGTKSNPTARKKGQRLGDILVRTYSSETGSFTHADSTKEYGSTVAGIYFRTEEDWDKEKSTQMGFTVMHDGKANTSTTMNSRGNVGIGTTNPQGRLHVNTKGIDGTAEDVYIVGPGKVGIGTTSPKAKLHVNGGMHIHTNYSNLADIHFAGNGLITADSRVIFTTGDSNNNNYFDFRVDGLNNTDSRRVAILNADGDMHAKSFNNLSDRNLKEEIAPLEDPIKKLAAIEGVSFQWKETGEQDIGVIAQDVEKVFPQLVAKDEETGNLSVNYSGLVAPVISSIGELDSRDHEMQEQIASLHAIIDDLQKEVEYLREKLDTPQK